MKSFAIGEIVIYSLSAKDAEAVNRRRTTGTSIATRLKQKVSVGTFAWPAGAQAHIGETVKAGDQLPLIIVKIGEKGVSGQVLLPGNDVLYVVDVKEGKFNGSILSKE